MSFEFNTHTSSQVRDVQERLSWKDMRELAIEAPSGVHFLSGGNSVSQAAILLAAAMGRCSAVPLNSRLNLFEREAIHNLFGQIDAPPGVFITTSGTQGKPKLVHLSPESLIQHATAVNSHLQVQEGDTWLACLPFFHIGGMAIVIRCALVGAGLRIIENSDAELVSKSLDGATLVSLVPTTLRRVLTAQNGNVPSTLRAIILGGGPIPADLLERCPLVLPTYGLTEAGSMVTCARPHGDVSERFTAGPAMPDTQVKIVDDNGNSIAIETVGRIAVKGKGAAKSYFRNEKETALTFREGWIYTEDAGYLDQYGYLHVLGRRDRIIVSGGENIALDEVEAAIRELDGVRDSLCVGLENAEWGQIVVAVIETDQEMDLEFVRKSLREKLASYKLPKQIATVSRLPLLANGKPDIQAALKLLG